MEKQKQKLLELIDNLDWNKLNEIIPCGFGFMNTLRMPGFKTLIEFLKIYQKEKTIEQKLEALGFIKSANCNRSGGLYYERLCNQHLISIWYIVNNDTVKPGDLITKYELIISNDKTKEALSFANYLVNLKNGADQ